MGVSQGKTQQTIVTYNLHYMTDARNGMASSVAEDTYLLIILTTCLCLTITMHVLHVVVPVRL